MAGQQNVSTEINSGNTTLLSPINQSMWNLRNRNQKISETGWQWDKQKRKRRNTTTDKRKLWTTINKSNNPSENKNQKDNQRQKLCRLERSRWSFLYNDWTKNNQASIIFCIFSWTALIRRLSQQQTISKFESTIYQIKQGPSLNIQGSVEQFLTMFELKCQPSATYYLLLHR